MRALKILVVGMGVLIVLGTLALVAVVVQRMAGAGEGAVFTERSLGQPAGTRILGVAVAEGRLAVLVARPDGERVLLVDPRDGRVLGQLRAAE